MSPIDKFILRAGLLYFFLVSFACDRVQAQPTVERGPQDAIVRAGDTVEFICDLANAGDSTVYWNHRESSLYLSVDRRLYSTPTLPPQLEQRLSIIGDESQDEFTLRITNVQETDEGTYSCLYGSATETPETAGAAELTVLVPPSPESPWCRVEPASAAVGDSVDLSCNVQGGKPAPSITYYKGNEQLVGPVTNSILHPYQLKAQDNGVTFTCIMTTPALDEPRNCSAMLLGILPTATILPAASRVEEGTSTTAMVEVNREQATMSVSSTWVQWEETTRSSRFTTGLLTDKPSSCQTNEQLSPVAVALIMVAAVLAVAVIVLIILLVRQKRKHSRKSTSPPAGPRMTQADHGYYAITVEGEQGQEMQEYAYAAVQEDGPITSEYLELQGSPACEESLEDKDGPITSEYLELQDSPACKESLEYAYATYPECKNDPTA